MLVSLYTLISNAMKRFIIKVTLFFALLVVADVLCGFALGYIAENTKGGFTERDTYICDKMETDFLLMGSSRCVRHYNPQIITDSLGMSCYNTGQMGNGIILNYGRLRMIDERKKPKVVVYDIAPDFDLFVGEDNHRYLTWLKQHYERNGIADIFESVDATEKYKMVSQMYRYNSRIIELMTDYIHPITDARADGFSPLKGEMDRTKIKIGGEKEKKLVVDSVKLDYINKLIDELDGSKLFFVVSPRWYGMDSLQLQPVLEICKKRAIPFIDFANNPKYVHQDIYFKDGNHMNERGADEFTKDLIGCLKKYYKEETLDDSDKKLMHGLQ